MKGPVDCLYIYKVFWHLDMLWMDMWVHPYTDMPLKMGEDLWEIGGIWLSPSDVVKSWMRLQSLIDCIPHLYYIYA